MSATEIDDLYTVDNCTLFRTVRLEEAGIKVSYLTRRDWRKGFFR